MSSGPLSNLTVLEYGTRVSGSYCCRVLADLGAEVLKVEPPGAGDKSRQEGRLPGNARRSQSDAAFLFLNANKKSITLDPRRPGGKALLERLLSQANVLVHSCTPKARAELGFEHELLQKQHPSLTITAITPYGLSGPYKDYKAHDLNVNAAGGLSFGIGDPKRRPLALPYSQASHMAGSVAALATILMTAFGGVEASGRLIDVAETEVIATLLTGYYLPYYIYQGIPGARAGRRARLGLFPNTVMPCKDGYACVSCPRIDQYLRFLLMLGDPSWAKEPRYRDRRRMIEDYPEESEELIRPWFAEHTKNEIFEMGQRYELPCVPVKSMNEVLTDSHLRIRNYFVEVQSRNGAPVTYTGLPYRFSAMNWGLTYSVPDPGEQNQEVYCGRLGYSEEHLTELRHEAAI